MPKFDRKVEIDAPVQKVWDTLINPNYWSKWFPGIDNITGITSVSEGCNFQWTNEKGTGSGSIINLVPLKRLEITTQMGKDKDSHVFTLRPSGGMLGLGDDECEVEYSLDTLMGGGILSNFISGGNPKDMLQVKKAMHLLRKVVESN